MNEELDIENDEKDSTVSEDNTDNEIEDIENKVESKTRANSILNIYVNPNANANLEDGTSNHPYTTINKAITSCMSNTDNIIHLSSHNHIINNTLSIKKNITITGNGKYNTNISCNMKKGFSVKEGAFFKIEKVRVQNANGTQGGVIATESNINLIINDCIFNNNQAKNGVVLFCSGNNIKCNITNCIFEQNIGEKYGVLQLAGSTSLFNIKKCTFTNNQLTNQNYSESTGGAAIYSGTYTQVNVYNSVFTQNKALWGNAILNGNHATLKIYNSNFTNNIADQNTNGINKTKGGAIAVGSGYSEIRNCRFINNKADIGGAISYNSGESNLIINCVFQQNKAFTQAGAINNYGSLTVKNSKFNKNNGTRRGGAILDIGNNEVLIQNCSFTDNKVLTSQISGNSIVPQGGAISIAGTCHNFSIKNSTFNHNSAYYGGAIYSETEVKKIEIEKTLFHNNTAHFGAAVILAGETTFETNNVSFNYNRALKQGGSIIINGSVHGHFDNTNFQRNTVSVTNNGYGGAIYINCYALLDFNNCNFQYNEANLKGGVICSMSVVSISISHSNITNNTATIGSGIYINNSKNYKTQESQIKIDTSMFAGNRGDRIFYSVKAYNDTWNNNIISTSWWGSNIITPRSEYHFKIKNYFLLTINIDYKRNDTVNWMNNNISMNLSNFDYVGKDVCLSFTTIKEGNTLKYVDAFLPSRTFKLKENNNAFTTQLIYVNYILNSNLTTIQIKLDNQTIIIKK